jgi:uncharacterized protein (DUF2384 family)
MGIVEPKPQQRILLVAEVLAAVLFIAMLAMPAFAAYSVPKFSDVGKDHEYYRAIMGLREARAVDGYPDNTFRPDQNVWRAQFAKMLVTAVGMTDNRGNEANESMVTPFNDLGPDDPDSLYPHEYVSVVADQGVALGVAPSKFSPFTGITRAQMVTMAVRAAYVCFPDSMKDPPDNFYSPLGVFSDTHAENMRVAEWNGLLDGLVGFGASWDPWAPATRGEVAQILWNMHRKS